MWMGDGTLGMSAICKCGWCEWICHQDKKAPFPHESEVPGRSLLGPAPHIGGEMHMRTLKATGEVHHQTTVCHLTPADLLSEENRKDWDTFDATIAATRGPAFTKTEFCG